MYKLGKYNNNKVNLTLKYTQKHIKSNTIIVFILQSCVTSFLILKHFVYFWLLTYPDAIFNCAEQNKFVVVETDIIFINIHNNTMNTA